MYEDDFSLQNPQGLPTASSLGVLVQILASNGKVSTILDLLECFSDGIHDLNWAVHHLELLGLIKVAPVEVDGMVTSTLEITLVGHTYLSMFAWELIENYQSYFRD